MPSNSDLLSHPEGSRHKVETRDKIWRIISLGVAPLSSRLSGQGLAAVWGETKVVVTCPGHVWSLSSLVSLSLSILPCLESGENLVK